MLVLRYLIFQLFSGTDFKITCQQELFSYLETLLSLCRFLHSPGYSIPFHSQNLVPSSFACFVRDLQAFERKKELSPFSSFTLRTTASMVDTKHMPDYDVTRMKQINKHERSSRVPNFFQCIFYNLWPVTCVLHLPVESSFSTAPARSRFSPRN